MSPRKSRRNKATKGKLALVLILFLFGAVETGYAQIRSAPVEVPFEFVQNQIIVTVKIAGKGPYQMLLDTDTDPSAIDLAAAKELGLGLDSRSYAATGGGSVPQTVQLTRLPSVELGTIIAKDVAAGRIVVKKIFDKTQPAHYRILGVKPLQYPLI